MVILVNYNPNPFKIEYTDNNQSFFKAIPTQAIVAMKNLRNISQISNKQLLIDKNITVWEFESNTYLHRSAGFAPTGSALPFIFVGNNVKPSDYVHISDGYSGTTAYSGMTFTADLIGVPTIYGFITSANTIMANATISAATIGNNRYISYSGATAVTTTNWFNAISSGATLPAGVTIAGYGAIELNAGSTFYLSATTIETDSGYETLKGMM